MRQAVDNASMPIVQVDVVVVGGGPAGAAAACELARANLNTIVIDKAAFPRYKPCGGGILQRAATLIPDVDLSPVTRDIITRMSMSYQLRPQTQTTFHYPDPLIYLVMRDEFDQLLIQRAVQAGADFHDNETVRRVYDDPAHPFVRIVTDRSEYHCRAVIGADGANGPVARQLGLMEGVWHGLALEAEIRVPDSVLASWRGRVGLDFGDVPLSYGWVFPKGQHLSIGVGGPVPYTERLQDYYRRHLRFHLRDVPYEVLRFQGHRLPLRERGRPVHRGRVLLAGDAAGVVEAWTGEGIGNALRSGQLAATTLKEALLKATPVSAKPIDTPVGAFSGDKKPTTLISTEAVVAAGATYQRQIDSEVMPELAAGKATAGLMNRWPFVMYALLRLHPNAWRLTARILRGERTYVGTLRKLGPYVGIIWRWGLPVTVGSFVASPRSKRPLMTRAQPTAVSEGD